MHLRSIAAFGYSTFLIMALLSNSLQASCDSVFLLKHNINVLNLVKDIAKTGKLTQVFQSPNGKYVFVHALSEKDQTPERRDRVIDIVESSIVDTGLPMTPKEPFLTAAKWVCVGISCISGISVPFMASQISGPSDYILVALPIFHAGFFAYSAKFLTSINIDRPYAYMKLHPKEGEILDIKENPSDDFMVFTAKPHDYEKIFYKSGYTNIFDDRKSYTRNNNNSSRQSEVALAFKFFELDPNSADFEQVSSAYRKKVVTAHPDRGGNDEAFKEVNGHFENLKKHFGK